MTRNTRIDGHFDRLSSSYDRYRTLDHEPVRYLASKLPHSEHTICDLGCGTGRYLFALIEQLEANKDTVNGAYGVDVSQTMLETARERAEGLGMSISWIEASADRTGLAPDSISLVTAFNVIFHLPIRETLEEVARIARPKALFAVYARLREQEAEHVWGRWFPGYIDYTINPTREFMLGFSEQNRLFRLVDSRDFTFSRKTTLTEICEQTEGKFYSTLARYPDSEFERAYETFVANLKFNFDDPNEVVYPSTYSMFLYQVE